MRKNIIIISIIVVCLGLVAALSLSRPRATITVIGNLSAADAAEIDRAIRRDRPDVYQNFSWRSLRGAPMRLWTRIRPYDTVIKSARGFTIVQTTARSFGTNGKVEYNSVLRNTKNGWNTIMEMRLFDAKFFMALDQNIEPPQKIPAEKIPPPLAFESNSFFEPFPAAQPWSPVLAADSERQHE